MKEIEIFTDGGCHGNPGPGGWGALLRYDGCEKKISGGLKLTTNNQMELQAVISALETLKEPCKVTLTTDSQYVKNGITSWVHNWKKKGWMTSARKPVKNKEFWQELLDKSAKHIIEWKWVKGHAGHRENEICDQLATEYIETHFE